MRFLWCAAAFWKEAGSSEMMAITPAFRGKDRSLQMFLNGLAGEFLCSGLLNGRLPKYNETPTCDFEAEFFSEAGNGRKA